MQQIGQIQLAVVEGFRPGMTEVELAKIVHRKAAELEGSFLGDDAIGVRGHLVCSVEKEPMLDIMALEGVTINKGDYI